MAKKTPPILPVEVSASAKAKLIIERKKVTTENIPEDVSRAKASAWLDLISPLTEWAGLKGDELRQKREILRVHKEITLTRIIKEAREKIAQIEGGGSQIPLKFIAPFIERASVEEDDPKLHSLWSSLLASAFTDYKPEFVHFCNIISQMSASQAEAFADLLGTNSAHSLELSLDNISMYLTSVSVRENIRKEAEKMKRDANKVDALESIIESQFNSIGIEVIHIAADFGDNYYDFTLDGSNYQFHDEVDYHILEALGLIKIVETDFFQTEICSLYASYYHLTRLGFRFAVSCGIVK